MNIGIRVMIVREDESALMYEPISIDMRGAMREVTHRYALLGCKPIGRWKFEHPQECFRVFTKV